MADKLKSIGVPLVIITLGLGWLLTTQNVIPGVNWVWVLGLGVTGVLVLAAGGIDKVTVVVGPFLMTATVFSLLRQTGRMSVDTEVPLLIIALGMLMIPAKLLPIPTPAWLDLPPKKTS
jgi:hypothetical protein